MGPMCSLPAKRPWCSLWRQPSFHEKDDLIDIFFLRKIIEPEIAQLAAENATPEEIDELEEILKEQEEERGQTARTQFETIPIFIISWPGWPRTGSWNAFFSPWLIFWAKPGKDTCRPRRENKNLFRVIGIFSLQSKMEMGRLPDRPCADIWRR